MTYQYILTDVQDAVAVITLNRPKVLNALCAGLVAELASAIRDFDQSDSVRCIIMTGSEKAFAAGADISEMTEKNFVDVYKGDFMGQDISSILQCRKPIIAAVAGYALGGGCEMAMMCDFIIAADTAKFGQPEITIGTIPGIGGSQRLTRLVGKSKAMEMILTGRMIDAEEAERAGLVSRIVAAETLLDDALKTAKKIASMSLPAVISGKEVVNVAYETSLNEGLRFERRAFHATFATQDQKEGMAAFLDKRAPKFTDQ